MTREPLHVGIELGGTKIVVGASTHAAELLARRSIPSRDPDTTFGEIRGAVEIIVGDRVPDGIGIASFGPIDLRKDASSYGTILATPKSSWRGADVVEGIAGESLIPVAVDTDVNAAVLGERIWGSGTAHDIAYLTVGTGIGGGIWSEGKVLHGANHPEIGHLRVPRHPDDRFAGSCPFHGDCLEGMASGTALRKRWGVRAESLGSQADSILEVEAWYVAHGIASLCSVLPVQQVIIGGGVSKMAGFHAAIAGSLPRASQMYPHVPFAEHGPEILAPGLGDDSGVVGAIELVRRLSET